MNFKDHTYQEKLYCPNCDGSDFSGEGVNSKEESASIVCMACGLGFSRGELIAVNMKRITSAVEKRITKELDDEITRRLDKAFGDSTDMRAEGGCGSEIDKR